MSLLNAFYKTLHNEAYEGMWDGYVLLLIDLETHVITFMQKPFTKEDIGFNDPSINRSLGVSIFNKSTGEVVHLNMQGRVTTPCEGHREVRLSRIHRGSELQWSPSIVAKHSAVLDRFFTKDDPLEFTMRLGDVPSKLPIPAMIPDTRKTWETTDKGHYKGAYAMRKVEMLWNKEERCWELRHVKFSGAFQVQKMAWEGLRDPSTHSMYLTLCLTYMTMPSITRDVARDALTLFKGGEMLITEALALRS